MQRRKAILQEFAQSTAGTVSAFCMKCPDEILSVLMFPDDHISVQMLHSYFTMALSADTLEGLRSTPPLLPYVPTCPVLLSTCSATPHPALVFTPAQPLERMSVGQRGFLCAQTPLSHLPGCHALQFGGHCLICSWGLYPLVQKGSLNVASASVLLIKI